MSQPRTAPLGNPAPRDPEPALLALERHSRDVTEALLQGQPERLAEAGAALQQGLRDLTAGTGLRLSVAQRQRLYALATQLVFQREGLMRRAALVDRSLQHLVPAAASQGYGAAARVYASAGRSTGQFARLSA